MKPGKDLFHLRYGNFIKVCIKTPQLGGIPMSVMFGSVFVDTGRIRIRPAGRGKHSDSRTARMAPVLGLRIVKPDMHALLACSFYQCIDHIPVVRSGICHIPVAHF